MPFGFFKKRGDKRPDDDLFDPTQDDLEFDVLESSSPFIEDASYAPAPPPPPPPAPPRPQHVAPPPRQAAPPPVPPRPAAPRPAPPRPQHPAPPASGFEDLTIVDRAPRTAAPGGPTIPAPGAPVPPTQARPVPSPRPHAAPPPPPPPAPPAHAAPPPRPAAPVAPPTRPIPPRRDGSPDVTMVMSGPVGSECLVAWLIVATGPDRGTDYRLPGGTARVGHDPGCDIRIAGDTYISSTHAEVSFRGGVYVLTDLGSTNGTFVNESRVDEAVLRDGDKVRLGVTQLVFKSFSL